MTAIRSIGRCLAVTLLCLTLPAIALAGLPEAGENGPGLFTYAPVIPDLRIDWIHPFPTPEKYGGQFPNPLLIELQASYPSEWGERDGWTVRVDGVEVAFDKPEFATVENGRRSYTFRVYPGPAGRKLISVTYVRAEGGAGTQRLDYTAESVYEHWTDGGVFALNMYSCRLLTHREPLQLIAYFVSELRVTLNGKPLPLTNDLFLVTNEKQLWIAQPDYEPGWNELQLSWKDTDGDSRGLALDLYYAPATLDDSGRENPHLIPGDRFYFSYGEYLGPGPLNYRLKVIGDGVRSGGECLIAWFPVVSEAGSFNITNTLCEPLAVARPAVIELIVESNLKSINAGFEEIARYRLIAEP